MLVDGFAKFFGESGLRFSTFLFNYATCMSLCIQMSCAIYRLCVLFESKFCRLVQQYLLKIALLLGNIFSIFSAKIFTALLLPNKGIEELIWKNISNPNPYHVPVIHFDMTNEDTVNVFTNIGTFIFCQQFFCYFMAIVVLITLKVKAAHLSAIVANLHKRMAVLLMLNVSVKHLS